MSKYNSTVINRLGKKSMQGSRKRNLVAVIAIVLTTFMIATVFSVGVSSIKNLSVYNDRTNGTRANVSAADISVDKVEQIRKLRGVKDVGLIYNAGTWKENADSDVGIYLYALDNEAWEKLMAPAYSNIVGSYPTGEYEIMLSMAALRQLGIEEPQIGQQIPLSYQSKGYELTDTFTLCGYFDTYITAQSWGMAYLSESYVHSHDLTLERDGSVLVRATDNSKNAVCEQMKALANGSGSDDESLIGYSISSEKLAEITVIVMLALFVVLSGYLLIYNIMYISVTRDIHFYGMLKTIGATSKQIRKLVYKQAGYLMFWGISIGVLLSILSAFVFLPTVMNWVIDSGNPAMPTEVSFSPVIYIGTVLFSALTVLISCRKPAKLAGKVSPVEAVKYTGIMASKRSERHSKSGGKLYKQAFYNVFRDKKRAALVFASLFMGVITFLSASVFLGSLDVHNYIERHYPWDFKYESTPPLIEEKFNDDFMDAINSLDGVTKKEIIRTSSCILDFDEQVLEPILRNEYERFSKTEGGSYDNFIAYLKGLAARQQYGAWFFSIPDEYLSVLADKYGQEVDIEAFHRGEICILAYGEYTEMIGRNLDYICEANGNSGSIKIGGLFPQYADCDCGGFAHVTGTVSAVYVSDNFMDKLNDKAVISKIRFNVEDAKEESVRRDLEKLNETLQNNTYFFSTQHDKAEEFKSTIDIYKVLSGGFSLGFILIGVINFFNVMATGIYSRRRELAMLESVGMTKKQTAIMLALEGAYYALITSLLILSLGSGVIAILAKLTPMIADYAVVEYPFLLIGGICLTIFAICMSVPPIVYRNVSKESVTERLRAVE